MTFLAYSKTGAGSPIRAGVHFPPKSTGGCGLHDTMGKGPNGKKILLRTISDSSRTKCFVPKPILLTDTNLSSKYLAS